VDQSFSNNLASKSFAKTTSQKRGYSGNQLVDGKPDTYWASDDRLAEIELTFKEPVSINRILLREGIEYGQRIKSFEVEAWTGNHYQVMVQGTTVGNKRILKFDEIKTEKVRVRITDAKAEPILSEVQLFKADY
jgi:alpha-L-fucosidase